MRLLLLKDVRKLGHVGDIVDVAMGYARNYLLPCHLATDPTEENIKAIAAEKIRAAAERAKRLKEYESLAEQMKDVTVTIEATANPEGTLYGGVHAREIAEALVAQGFPVEPSQVQLDGAIRQLDNRVITIEFTDEIQTQIKLWVVRAGEAIDDGSDAESDDESDDESDEELATESDFEDD